MAEIKPMNLPGVSFDPRDGLPQQKTLAENLRGVAERKFMRQMQQYNIKKSQREEEAYNLNKKAENFIFSNYPSSKAFGDFTTANEERKFGAGSEEKYMKQWKEQVGGNYGAFQQWFQASKAKEDASYWKSFQRNPGKYKTEKQYKKAISDYMNSMDNDEQQRFLADAPPEIQSLMSEYWDANDSNLFGVDTKDILTGAGLTTLAGGAIYGASQMFGATRAAGKIFKRNIDDLAKKAGNLGKEVDRVDDFIGPGIAHNKLGQVNRSLNKMVKANKMNKSDADAFTKLLDDMAKSGKTVNAKSIENALLKDKDKYESLINAISKSRISSIGPLSLGGLATKLGMGMGVAVGASQYMDDGNMYDTIGGGFAAGDLARRGINVFDVARRAKQVKDKMGTAKFTKFLMKKGGTKLLAGMAGKALLGATGPMALVSGAFLISDIMLLNDILSDAESEMNE